MFKKSSALVLGLLITSQGAFADKRPIDVSLLNSLFASLAVDALKSVEATRPGLVEKLELKFDESTANLEKGSEVLEATAVAGVSKSKWDATAPSSLALGLGLDNSTGDTVAEVQAKLTSNTSGFLAWAVGEWLDSQQPCSEASIEEGADAGEVQFNKEACVYLEQLRTVESTVVLLDTVHKIADLRLVYVEGRIEALNATPSPSETETLYLKRMREEQGNLKALTAALTSRTDKRSVTVTFPGTVNYTDSSILAVVLEVSPTLLGVTFKMEDKNGEFVEAFNALERFSKLASAPEGSPEKKEFLEGASFTLDIFLGLAAEAIAP